MSLQRLRTVEENIEAERAAHLETKFNSEIIQVLVNRVMDVNSSSSSHLYSLSNDSVNHLVDLPLVKSKGPRGSPGGGEVGQ